MSSNSASETVQPCKSQGQNMRCVNVITHRPCQVFSPHFMYHTTLRSSPSIIGLTIGSEAVSFTTPPRCSSETIQTALTQRRLALRAVETEEVECGFGFGQAPEEKARPRQLQSSGRMDCREWIEGLHFVMIRLDEFRTVGLIFNHFSWSGAHDHVPKMLLEI